ncbi:hypothetical protein [Latilactobacillus curvatus]|uniref:hypothetical protein n=1 Tax=Latilactobacillus curvatus TaxID=28038 RepID=UPI0020A33084|nr:hypothetical protein [Latilactobacillus curvatus]UTC12522.1 hypothetical protein A4W75_05370 [Latilactobacillus curvatus]
MKKTHESVVIDTTNTTASFKPFYNTTPTKPISEEQQKEYLKAIVQDMCKEYHKTISSGSRNWSTMTVSNYIAQLKSALGVEDD